MFVIRQEAFGYVFDQGSLQVCGSVVGQCHLLTRHTQKQQCLKFPMLVVRQEIGRASCRERVYHDV